MDSSDEARLANLLAVVATGLVDRVRAAGVDTAHIHGAAGEALVVLLDFSPQGSVHALSQAVGLTHSGAVRLVDRLADAGWVTRRPGADARSITIVLTRRGRTVAERLRSRRNEEVVSVLADLTSRQRRDLLRSCEVIVANLTKDRLAIRAAGEVPVGGALCRMCDFVACGRSAGRCPAATAATAANVES